MAESIVCLTRQCNPAVPGDEIILGAISGMQAHSDNLAEAGTGLIDDCLAKLGLHRKYLSSPAEFPDDALDSREDGLACSVCHEGWPISS